MMIIFLRIDWILPMRLAELFLGVFFLAKIPGWFSLFWLDYWVVFVFLVWVCYLITYWLGVHSRDLAPSKGEAGEIGRENGQWYNSRFTWDKEKNCLLNYLCCKWSFLKFLQIPWRFRILPFHYWFSLCNRRLGNLHSPSSIFYCHLSMF